MDNRLPDMSGQRNRRTRESANKSPNVGRDRYYAMSVYFLHSNFPVLSNILPIQAKFSLLAGLLP
ncbi:hypothetical protein, partial [Klebsiella pneumoniae]|uniref:hypothetical protein n=1 Tax=Klebsiella pneumoniae TaxID=573 RepID=UPI002FF2662F